MKRAGVAVLFALLAGCRMPGEKVEFSKISEDFVYGSLALSPVSATAAGYHQHRGVTLDTKLDDFSQVGIAEQRLFYRDFDNQLQGIQADSLDAEDRADFDIIRDQVRLAMLDLFKIQSFRHNPAIYVELIGNALFTPFVLEYAPKPERYRQIIKRLAAVPILLEQARENLQDSPEVWNRVAREENAGNIELIGKTMRAGMPAELQADYETAAKPALAALDKFNKWLANDLSKRTTSWRLGQANYEAKFKYSLGTGKLPAEILLQAEAALRDTRDQMAKIAKPSTVEEALNRIALKHATPETYLDQARRDLEQATAFVKSKRLMTVPGGANLRVIPTPEFMRGGYGVGGFNPPPALEPQLGAFYWITPIDPAWPPDRVESKLREYNTYGLQQLTVHEAMPGHYLQAEYANRVEPKGRRVLRAIYGNVPYVEGWGVYAQQLMTDQGYPDQSPDARLTYLKQMLRVISNAILDIRLHTMDMSEQDAMALMVEQTYQEKEEARAKLQRAQLSACQLPTYFVGWQGWLHARAGRKDLASFHEKALKEGAVPLPALERLLR